MKAIVKKVAGTGVVMQQVEMPTISANEVLIKIKKTSICGTDLSIYKWSGWAQKNVPVPVTIGHEFMGEVVEVGSSVTTIKVGDRVTGEGHLTCGKCPGCKTGRRHLCQNVRGVGYHVTGCFAEYFKLPQENIFLLPDSVSDEMASIFDPYGNAVHTALSFPLIAEDVLITGAGPIGMMATAIAKQAGARSITITDINPYRLKLAQTLGATHAINVLDDPKISSKPEDGFGVGMEMSGNPKAFDSMLEMMQYGGKVALLGILPIHTTIDWDHVIFKMLTLKGIYGREIFGTWLQMVRLLEGGLDLSPIITHRLKADDFEKGFEVMANGTCGKVILDWE
jgi:threonine 3-dehydrogenase